MKKSYISQLFPGIKESQLAIPYFCFTSCMEEDVSELRVGVRRSSSVRHQSKGGVLVYPLYKPTSIANYPILKQVVLTQSK